MSTEGWGIIRTQITDASAWLVDNENYDWVAVRAYLDAGGSLPNETLEEVADRLGEEAENIEDEITHSMPTSVGDFVDKIGTINDARNRAEEAREEATKMKVRGWVDDIFGTNWSQEVPAIGNNK